MRVSEGAYRMNSQGGFIHLHFDSSFANAFITSTVERPLKTVNLAPLEIRHAVYSELIRLSPASGYRRSLVIGPKGLIERGFSLADANAFGGLPPNRRDRDELCFRLHRFLLRSFPALKQQQISPLIGVPGFWQESGRVRLWKKIDYEYPFLVIPYRDAEGRIQACQLRSSGLENEIRKRYCWLSSAGEPNGTGTGDPIHFTFLAANCPANSSLIVTEGALKAESFVHRQPDKFVIAVSGIGNSRDKLIAATQGHDLLIAFDSDHSSNPAVAGQLASLIADRARDLDEHSLANSTKVMVWDNQAKGIDDAALLNLPMRTITVQEWYSTLTGNVLERVKNIWEQLGFSLPSFC
ncbi:MAG TPA: hypothetical protein VFC63_22905 [Blastocatellia bacterium]|nr:hypothetical protein [Blastocatellia bacterium]